MEKILIITANSGGLDTDLAKLHAPQAGYDNIGIIQFNDQNFPLRSNAMSPRLQAKIPKMLGWEYFPGMDYYIWLDGSIRLANQNTVDFLIKACSKTGIAFFNHPDRSSIADELSYMHTLMASGNEYLRLRYENEPMKEQVEKYLSDTSFLDNRLYCGGFFSYTGDFLKQHAGFFTDWFYQCARYSIQDQLSLPYMLHKHSIQLEAVPSAEIRNHFEILPQLRSRIA